ncbi:MAG: hypothetical protein HOM47_02360 [Euryarchaeota archaeon]|nr:hypothetical protein [Euryarchaeota archaeon]MBT5183998.1 hypothetical protein [Euryarchaeota archaeon]
MKKVLLLIAILLLPATLAEQFPTQNVNYGFVGWSEGFIQGIGEYRISYPAVEDGEDTNFAQNGPFAIVVFYPDEGEELDQYVWLQDGLSKWGYITLVCESSWSDINSQLSDWNNNQTPDLVGAQGMFATDYVAMSGHGTGAHYAAEIVKEGQHEIDGLFGLGLEGTSTSTTVEVLLTNPSSALFLTGTTDEIAPASENVMTYLEDWNGAWQVMHPLGANHLGYQESDTFFERFIDGDSTMGREGQQQHALDHIIPYLNLSLRGDDSSYQAAFNREDKSISADSNAYIDEDLSRSRLYNLTDIHTSTQLVMQDQELSVTANVTMRDGGVAYGNVSCILPNDTVVIGLLQNGIASCAINGTVMSPGSVLIELIIADYSFSDWLGTQVIRLGTPLNITDPMPEITLDQHSSVNVTPDLFAVDPDGEEVIFVSAQLVGNNQSILELNRTSSKISITHNNLPEWDGTMEMELLLAAGDDSANITVNVTVLPVNDKVVQTAVIPQQQEIEDGPSIVLDISEYVSDPEGQPLQVNLSREYPGLRINSSLTTILIDPQMHWNGAELVELHVSDGETDYIEIFVPINIVPADDTIQFIQTELEVEMDEDGVVSIDLDNYTIDVDGDVISYEITGSSEIVGYSLATNELVIAGNPNMFGVSQFNLNVSDGSNSDNMTLIITTNSVPDLPTVTISSVSTLGDTISILWTIEDVDGDTGLVKSVTFAGESIELGTECTGIELMTCITDTKRGPDGIYTVEAKVWDGHAQEWSNTATQDVELTKVETVADDTESEIAIGDWVLPIGLGIFVTLLAGYLIQSKKKTS